MQIAAYWMNAAGGLLFFVMKQISSAQSFGLYISATINMSRPRLSCHGGTGKGEDSGMAKRMA